MFARLDVVDGENSGIEFRLVHSEPFSLGLSEEKLLVNPLVGTHCRIEFGENAFVLVNLFAQGTRVNEALVQERVVLHSGDMISLGTHRLRYMPMNLQEQHTNDTPTHFGPFPDPVQVDSQFEHYRVDRILSRTSLGMLTQATDLRTQTPVALKFLRGSRPILQQIIERAEQYTLLDDPHLAVPLGIIDSWPFVVVVMPWFEGRSLHTIREALPVGCDFKPSALMTLILSLTHATIALHNRGLVHGRIEPKHIFVTDPEATIVLLGFPSAQIDTQHLTPSHDIRSIAQLFLSLAGIDPAGFASDPSMTFPPGFPDEMRTILLDILSEQPRIRNAEDLLSALRRIGYDSAIDSSFRFYSFASNTIEDAIPEALRAPIDFLDPKQADDELGRLAGYRILDMIGGGGMGIVFHAADPLLCREVAIKVMRPWLRHNEELRARFLREAQAVARLKTPHVVNIFQAGTFRDHPFMVMELLEGESLHQYLLSRRRIPWQEAARYMLDITEGLAFAHDAGLIHRDLKPSNLWREQVHIRRTLNGSLLAKPDWATRQTRIKILDFGLVKDNLSIPITLKGHGRSLGTPEYIAPERLHDEPATISSDIFSLGCIFYRMVGGMLPFSGSDLGTIAHALQKKDPPDLTKVVRNLPEPVWSLIKEMLAKRPSHRPESCDEIAKRLRGHLRRFNKS